MGSEMCIRDRGRHVHSAVLAVVVFDKKLRITLKTLLLGARSALLVVDVAR